MLNFTVFCCVRCSKMLCLCHLQYKHIKSMNFEGESSIRCTLLINIEYNDKTNYDFIFNLQNHNTVCSSLWVWNLVFTIQGKKQTDSVWEHGAEQNAWTWNVGNNWGWRYLHNRSFIICTPCYKNPGQVLLVWDRREMHTKLQLEDLKERGHWEDLSIDGRIILKWF